MISLADRSPAGRKGRQRVLFTTSAWPAQQFPMAALAWAFHAAGHDVLVASEPALVPAVTGTGLAATAIGGRDCGRTTGWTNRSSAAWNERLRSAESLVDDLVRLARRWRPDLIVHDATSLAGSVAGSVIGVATVGHLAGSPGVVRMEPPPDDSLLRSRYSRLFTRFGAEPRPEPTAWVDPCPPSMALPAEGMRLPVRFVPSHGSGSVPAWLFDPLALPRVCVPWWVGPATMADDPGKDAFRQVMEGVTTLDAEIVLAVTASDRARLELGSWSSTVRVVDSAALPTLLRTCDAVVHQGWAGTTLTAAVCGTPQLVVGLEPEHTLSSDRLLAVGAGRSLLAGELPPGEIGADIVGGEAAKLLDRPAYGAAAQRLRAEIEQQPTPAELVCTMVHLAADLRTLSQSTATLATAPG